MEQPNHSKAIVNSPSTIAGYPRASIEQLLRIHSVCTQFEQAWDCTSKQPAIETYLELVPQDDYPHLLESLIRSQRELEESTGATTDITDLLKRFPGYERAVRRAFLLFEEVESHDNREQWRTHVAVDPGPPTIADSVELSTIPKRLGHFEVLHELARGGMGIVYRARHVDLERNVALKIIRSGQWACESEVARFRQEAMAAASLQHESIVPIYEVGSDQGFHFYSMPLIDGEDLAARIARGPLDAKSIAKIVCDVARAVAYAHDHGIVHRDLKPRNIMISIEGKVHVLDFGLATYVDRNPTSLSDITKTGELLGTPNYMPPEQVQGKADRRSDQYSLGAVLYAGLCARPPHQAPTVIETIRQICEREPASPRSMNPLIPKDLETICLKALQKNPAQRYASMLDFAEDLQRFLVGKPVSARPISTLERTLRWSRRNPAWSTAILCLGLLLVVAWQLTWRNIAQTRQSLVDLRLEQRRTLAEQSKTKAALAVAQKSLYQVSIAQASNAWSSLDMLSMSSPLEQCPTELRHWEWSYLQNQSDRRNEYWHRESSSVRCCFVSLPSPGQPQCIGYALENGEIILRDASTKQEIFRRESTATEIGRLALFGKRLFVVERRKSEGPNNSDYEINSLDLENPGSPGFGWKAPKGFEIADFGLCAAKSRIAVAILNKATLAGKVVVLDASVDPPVELATYKMPSVGHRLIAYSQSGDSIAVAGGDQLVHLMNPETFEVMESFEAYAEQPKNTGLSKVFWLGRNYDLLEGGVTRVALSPNGKFIAAGMHNGQIRTWNRETKKLVHVFQCERDIIWQLAFSDDDRFMAVCTGSSFVIYIYDLRSGKEVAKHQGHVGRITSLRFLENGDLVSSSNDQSLRVWQTSDRSDHRLLQGHSKNVLSADFHPHGKILATGDGTLFSPMSPGTIRFWDVESRTCVRKLEISSSVGCIQYDDSGSRLAVACGDGTVRIFQDSEDKAQELSGNVLPVISLAWNPLRNELATVTGSIAFAFLPGEATIWDTKNMSKRLELAGHKAALSSVAYSRDGRVLATGSADKTVRLWNAETGECLRTLQGPNFPVLSLAIDPNGKWIAAGSGDIWNPIQSAPGEIYMWDIASGDVIRTLIGHSQIVHGLAVTPDGKRLISCARNDKIRVWDTSSGVEMLTLVPSDYACGVRFSPDAKQLVVPNWSGLVDVFHASPFGSH